MESEKEIKTTEKPLNHHNKKKKLQKYAEIHNRWIASHL